MQVSRLLQRGILWWFPFVWLFWGFTRGGTRATARETAPSQFRRAVWLRCLWPKIVLQMARFCSWWTYLCQWWLQRWFVCTIMYISCFSTPFKSWIKTSTTSTDALRARCHPEDSTTATATCTRGTKASLQQRFHWNLGKFWPSSCLVSGLDAKLSSTIYPCWCNPICRPFRNFTLESTDQIQPDLLCG